MASLAPGNGWFPERAHPARHGASPERRLTAGGNVFAFPGTPNTAITADRWQVASGSAVAAVATRLAALLVADSIKAGRSARWALGRCLFGLVAASLVWMGVAAALVAAALFYGVPWLTIAVAATLVHALGATLAVLMGLRIGRAIVLAVEKRNQRLRKAA